MRMMETITNKRKPWLDKKFSLSAPLEMYGKQYREYTNWCWSVKSYVEKSHLLASVVTRELCWWEDGTVSVAVQAGKKEENIQ